MTAAGVTVPDFPDGFVWGTATASYQIEGGAGEDGRGRSIWDTFSHTPGKIKNGDTGDVACDSYHRWPEDVRLLAGLGVNAYRFSIAWPRIQPDGTGAPNPAGLAYYDRLVDALCAEGIAPAVTLYHWDLPQALEDAGGWLNRDTAYRLAEYAGHVYAKLGDRVRYWFTLNEPFVTAAAGYAVGRHAPGKALYTDSFPVVHHELLAHGLAARALRDAGAAQVGLVNNLGPVHPATDRPEDVAAARRLDGWQNRIFCDPVLRGRYPEDLAELYPDAERTIRDGDLDTIAVPLDLLGVNYYFPHRVRAADGPEHPLGYESVPYEGVPHTGFGWPVVPEGFTEVLTDLRDRYGDALPPVYVTENGSAWPDELVDGRVHDPDRIAYLAGHLRALHAAIEAGVDIRGYFCWSLLDNFEWAEGYSQRFGIVYVDFATGERIPKASYDFYRSVVTG